METEEETLDCEYLHKYQREWFNPAYPYKEIWVCKKCSGEWVGYRDTPLTE